MSALAPTMQAFFTERLQGQRQASPNTIAAYRDTFRLLLTFTVDRLAKTASEIRVDDLDAELIASFLDHLEHERANSTATRNARLAAIRSLFNYAALKHPEHADTIGRVLAIPPKRGPKPLVTFLSDEEIDALLAAPDRAHWTGRRDHALLLTMLQTGLRVSELTGLNCADITLTRGPHLHCHGKGRKQRITPLTPQTAQVLRVWRQERAGNPDDPLFPTSRGGRLSRDAVAWLLAKHVATATHACPSLHVKPISPHTLRHTAAMRLLHAGVDITVIALWLGHESTQTTQIYLHADLALKERALARTTPPNTRPGRYRPPDQLLAFLESL
jgi:site-specific recombinase XerD